MAESAEQLKSHCIIFPWPIQGHINPMLQFAKRLHHKGLKITLLVTNYLAKTKRFPTDAISTETYTDGYDDGIPSGIDHEECAQRFLEVAPASVKEAVERIIADSGDVSCIVYDSYLPWALDVAKDLRLLAAPFFTQSCAVDYLYYLTYAGDLEIPVSGEREITIPGVPPLVAGDLPSFLTGHIPFPTIFKLAVLQFQDVAKADWLIINTFYESEKELVEHMRKLSKVATIGPTVPSVYLDRRLADDGDYGLSLYKPATGACMEWLSRRVPASVVYVSFGSVTDLGEAQMAELAWGLKLTGKPVLWVVRSTEQRKVPEECTEGEETLIVAWCPQLDVLSHPAVGCFVSHCGWNSTLEALSLGVPVVAVPQWSDQPTNAKFVTDVWKIGVRAAAGEDGVVGREKMKVCVEEVMVGEKGAAIRRNAAKWKELARTAMDAGGSSDRSIDEFIASCGAFKTVA
ncbi:UDP-glycosyltransferase 74E2-like [Andrographis paniculata]|uniref:UDP-glycosyltransferase 74E2-like n=1 Tax=Andrographis paniculata TaxID=175694 RepID=UPI0021E7A1E3|nr:UDP-glycosyltransferase 74E2-like [Andrographis paniculata]